MAAVTFMTVFVVSVAIAMGFLLPEQTDELKKKSGTVVDVGHADQGYIYVKHKAGKKRLKLRISSGSESYTYDLNQNGEFELFPLQMGSGSYKVRVFEHVKGSQYSGVSSISFSADIEDENLPYLYPSQYVSYGRDSQVVAESAALCDGMNSAKEKAEAVVEFVSGRFMYDYMGALLVSDAGTYLPNVDKTLETKKGICFDFAALVSCMLRVQGIPTKLVIGYADHAYHAWNQVYIDGQWHLVDTTAMITDTIVKRYTPERWY
jgi:hypothetical protein